jgi:hypothetical protein
VCYSPGRTHTGTVGKLVDPFGSSPKDFHTCGKHCGKRRLRGEVTFKSLISGRFSGGEAMPIPVLRASVRYSVDTSA